MAGLWSATKQGIRSTLIRVIPRELRRRLVARFPKLPLAPYSVGEASAQFDGSSWEQFYADPDPYGLATSDYESQKYARTLDCIGEGPFERVLEVGCSVGVFTELLAPRCVSLLAVDISDNAIKQARERTAAFPQVVYERRVLPMEMPSGHFDLIVCSDTLFYWPLEDLRQGIHAFENALSPGGRLVALHYTQRIEPGAPLDGNTVHELLKRELKLEHSFSETYEKYLLDRFEKAT